jgi:uncharacterized protein CbrC (UPF0167 family)
MSGAPHYRYLANPHRLAKLDPGPRPCAGCGAGQPAYYFESDFGERVHPLWVCDDCLTSGRLRDQGLRVNRADRCALEEQLLEARPELCQEPREALVQERTAEVEYRTPPLPNLPGRWPAHCGDYCRCVAVGPNGEPEWECTECGKRRGVGDQEAM